MHVYFVRHGETLLNRHHRHQSPGTPLSPTGREQAYSAGEYLRPFNPTMLITSTYTRALETARIIGSILDITPSVNPLFREAERPTALCGRSLFAFESFWYAGLSILFRHNPMWHYADAENFTDLRIRIDKALDHLESLHGEHDSVVVVSHTLFINLITAYMCNRRTLTLFSLVPHFIRVMRMRNLEVVHLKYVESPQDCGCEWVLAP